MKLEVHKAATAFLLNWDEKRQQWRIFLIDHKKIGKLIPIGGHVEKGEPTEKAVVREVLEEIGLKINLFWDSEVAQWVKEPSLYSIQIEKIPSFQREPEHFHEDYMYVGFLPDMALKSIKTGVKRRLHWIYIDDVISRPKQYNIFPEILKTFQGLKILPPPRF